MTDRIERDAPQDGSRFHRRALADAAAVLAEAHIPHPMHLMLDAPMAAHRLAHGRSR